LVTFAHGQAAITVNTQAMFEDEALRYMAGVEARMGLPPVDPFRQGADRIAEALDAL